jgi:hypothetical protein
MRKVLSSFILLILAASPSQAANVTTFEGGEIEAIAGLYAPGCRDVINITLPSECHILKATMNVSASLPGISGGGCPEAVQIFLNDSLIWEFNGSGYGAFGMQEKFINGAMEWNYGFDLNGGVSGIGARMPKNAVVQNATMEITCSKSHAFGQIAYFTGEAVEDYFGYSVSNAGDVNKDGYEDIIVGANSNDAGGHNAGRAYIYFGGASMDSSADVILTSACADEWFGGSVSDAGDVNNDGYDDVVAGAHGNNALGLRTGRAYIYFGGANMDNTADIILTGENGGDDFGNSVSGAGDVNKDGYDDVVVGAFHNDAGGSSAGRVYIYYGGAIMDNKSDVSLTGAAAGFAFGKSVSDAGDVNNDGYGDVIVGTIGSGSIGRAYLFYGGTGMDSTADVNLTGTAGMDSFGLSVSGAGDINNDGYDDVIVGAEGDDTGGPSAGHAYIYFGGLAMDNTADLIFTGSSVGDCFGSSVSGASDVNNDGYDDVIVAAEYNDSLGDLTGQAYVFYGGASMDNRTDVTLTGSAAMDLFGCSVSGAGDVDNDGYNDIIVGARFNDSGGDCAGRAYVFTSTQGTTETSIHMGSKSIWKKPGCFSGTDLSRDFGPDLNQLLRSSATSGTDAYNNDYVNVPIQVSCKSAGNITLSKLRIAYSVDTIIPDFTDKLNKYIIAHKADKDAGGNLSIPIRVASGTPGRLGLNDLFIMINEAPRLVKAIPDVELPEDSIGPRLLDLHAYFEDDNNTKDQLKFSIISATNNSFVKVNVVGNRFISADAWGGDANDNWTGEVKVVVQAADDSGSKRLSNPFRIIVNNENDAPVIISQPPANGTGGQEYLYQVVALDGDNDPLIFALTNKPENMTINGSTGLLRWVPSKGGSYNITVTASDGTLTASQEFTIAVPNRPPRVTNGTVPTAYVNETYVYAVQAVDDDGDPLSFWLADKVAQMTLDPSTGNLTWTPKQVGDFPVSVSISDGTDTTRFDFTIKVVKGNRAPRFSSSPVTTAFVGLPYIYDADAADMDNDSLTFLLVASPAGMAIENATGRIIWTPVLAGNYIIKLAVADGKGGEGTQEFEIKVRERIRAMVEFTAPAEGKNVKGKLAVNGKAINGTLEVVKVQLQVDSGDWMNVTGNSTWQFTVDTTKLKNGKHTLQVRAYDGMDYSDIVDRTITVDNAKPAGKGFIPGYGALLTVLAAASLILWQRKWKGK